MHPSEGGSPTYPNVVCSWRIAKRKKRIIEERRIFNARDAGIFIRCSADISHAFGACLGCGGLILTEADLAAEFFDLHTGLAGELFQKFINYKVRLAIVLPDPSAYGERFSELAYEHSSHSLIRFVRSQSEATAWLSA